MKETAIQIMTMRQITEVGLGSKRGNNQISALVKQTRDEPMESRPPVNPLTLTCNGTSNRGPLIKWVHREATGTFAVSSNDDTMYDANGWSDDLHMERSPHLDEEKLCLCYVAQQYTAMERTREEGKDDLDETIPQAKDNWSLRWSSGSISKGSSITEHN